MKAVNRIIGALHWLVGLFMIYAGAATIFIPPQDVEGRLGFIYSNRFSLAAFGLLFAFAGGTLVWGKIRKSRRSVGRGLLAIYLCFFFAAILNAVAFHTVENWIGNAICALVVGGLWLHWKFKTEYINPRPFARQIPRLRHK